MFKHFFSAIFVFTVCVAATPAQSAAETAAKNARDRFSDIKNRSFELERMKRDGNRRPPSENSASRFPKIKEDFEEIQKINSESLQTIAAETPTDYAAVLKSVSEINQRAARLKSNLFAIESESEQEVKSQKQIFDDRQDLKILIAALDKSINRFVHSSIFQNTNLVNSQDSLDAQNDLETVIKISSSIKGKAKKLVKENSKK